MELPESIKNLLLHIQSQGFSAYAVGGCVRDALLGKTPDDWDLTSSARPEELMALFGENALPTGLKHGTVTVRWAGFSAEITTFRRDGFYSDHRRPDTVSFSRSLTDDLSRRDFTMNAIACGADGTLVDPFHGQEDIRRRLIRCVGEPKLRFDEDALRMFRALRFSAVLGFSLDGDTRLALEEKAALAAEIAPERIRTELEKLLLADELSPLTTLFDSGLMDAFCPRVRDFSWERLASLPREARTRWAGLCAVLEGGGTARTADFLQKLRCDKATVRLCTAGVEAALASAPRCGVDWKRLLSRLGPEAGRCAAAAAFVRGDTGAFALLERVLDSGECWSLKQLAVNGRDLAELGFSGRAAGQMLERLLAHVIEAPGDNSRDALLNIAKNG